MKRVTPAVQWHPGMRLTADAFTQQQQYHDEALASFAVLQPYYWGIIAYDIDSQALMRHCLKYRYLHVVGVDGLQYVYTEQAQLPEPITITQSGVYCVLEYAHERPTIEFAQAHELSSKSIVLAQTAEHLQHGQSCLAPDFIPTTQNLLACSVGKQLLETITSQLEQLHGLSQLAKLVRSQLYSCKTSLQEMLKLGSVRPFMLYQQLLSLIYCLNDTCELSLYSSTDVQAVFAPIVAVLQKAIAEHGQCRQQLPLQRQNHRLWHTRFDKPYRQIIITAEQPLTHLRVYRQAEFEHCLKYALPGLSLQAVAATAYAQNYAYSCQFQEPSTEDLVFYNTIDEALAITVWGVTHA